jgi:hypothetical protein
VHQNTSQSKLSYEPPKIEDLGTLVDVTAGAGTPGTDVSGSSAAV